MTLAAMPATQRKGPAKPRVPKVHIASFGLENYWRQWRKKEDFSHITTLTMADLMESSRIGKDAFKVHLNDGTTIKIIQRRFIEEFPLYKDCTIILINCMNMGDPHHDKNLRSHK
eukprot:10558449-Karenia_brevis.AAC.1